MVVWVTEVKAGTEIPEWAEDVSMLCPKSRKALLTEQISEQWPVQSKFIFEKHRITQQHLAHSLCMVWTPTMSLQSTSLEWTLQVASAYSTVSGGNVTLVLPTTMAFPSVTCYFFSWCKASWVSEPLNVFLYPGTHCFHESRVISLCSTQDELLSLLVLTDRIRRKKGAN